MEEFNSSKLLAKSSGMDSKARWSLEPTRGCPPKNRVLYCGRLDARGGLIDVIETVREAGLCIDVVATSSDDRYAFRALRLLLNRPWPLIDQYHGDGGIDLAERVICERTRCCVLDESWFHTSDVRAALDGLPTIRINGSGSRMEISPVQGANFDADIVERVGPHALAKWLSAVEATV